MPSSSSQRVIVVGAGVVGCSLAFHLARARARVTIYGQSEVCSGMSARSGALLRMHYTFAPEADLAWKSLRYFRDWDRIVGGECGFVRTGFALIVGPDNVDRLRNNAAMMRNLGIDVEICDGSRLQRIDPFVSLVDVALAAYEPQSGYADPVATTRSFAAAAERLGADFRPHTPISEIVATNGRMVVREASGHTSEVSAVGVAAGPWTDRLLAPLGAAIGIKAERAQVAFFGRDRTTQHLAYIDCITGSYFRPHGSGLTLVGMGAWRPEAEPDPDSFRESNDPGFLEETRRRLGHRIPAMHDAPYVRGHAGVYDVTPDSRPVLGRVPGFSDLYVAAGFSGTGFKTAPAVGAAMAELILTGRTADLGPFDFERIRSGRL
ncbi:MAG TPA: FAD-dependent oxidoreductase, partial [Candidatus Binataceae bacterium]|nr:FAD-dependent oxidoreductase [Candidatus Binataceae bacterium]